MSELKAVAALTQILGIVQNYLPPDSGMTADDALGQIIAVVDPWPLDSEPPATDALLAAEVSIGALIDKSPAKAVSFLAAHFVGLMVSLVSAEGGDSTQQIKIEAEGNSRDITIHAKKTAKATEGCAAMTAWQPIETAPKDGRFVLLGYKRTNDVIVGQWCMEKYHTRPKPYWTNDRERAEGIRRIKSNQPDYWMPLPALPTTDGAA